MTKTSAKEAAVAYAEGIWGVYEDLADDEKLHARLTENDFKAGYDTAITHERERSRGLVEALEGFVNASSWEKHHISRDAASSALTDYKRDERGSGV